MDATRRDVLRLGIAVAGMTAGAMTRSFAEDATSAPHQPSIRKGDMLYRPLGNTGEQVSVLGLGGHHIGRATDRRTGSDSPDPLGDRSWHDLHG